MRLLIAGSSGYVGQSLTTLLDNQSVDYLTIAIENREAQGTDRRFTLRDKSKSIIGTYSLTDVGKEIDKQQISSIINLAGNTSKKHREENRRDLFNANILYNYEMLEMSVLAGIENYHFITTYSSSIDGSTFSPQTLYAGTKFCSEKLIETYAYSKLIRTSIIEIYDVYGPAHPHNKIIDYCYKNIKTNKDIHLSSGEQEINLIYIQDLVEGIYNIVQNQERNQRELSYFSIYSLETFKVMDIPEMISRALKIQLREDQIKRDLPNRDREIMRFNPRYSRPQQWIEKFNFKEGIMAIDRYEKQLDVSIRGRTVK